MYTFCSDYGSAGWRAANEVFSHEYSRLESWTKFLVCGQAFVFAWTWFKKFSELL